jgi:hypothetical protein
LRRSYMLFTKINDSNIKVFYSGPFCPIFHRACVLIELPLYNLDGIKQ